MIFLEDSKPLISILVVISVILGVGLLFTFSNLEEKEEKIETLSEEKSNLETQVSNLKDTRKELRENISEVEEKLNKPRVESSFDGWFENEDRQDEMLFHTWVLNFGDREIKNIEISCGVSKSKEVDTFNYTFSENVGNLASHSSEKFELSKMKNEITGFTPDSTAICYATSCEDCILLSKRIPGRNEEIERLK